MRHEEINNPVFWLQDAGFSAYLIGNQVRDRLLNIETDKSDVDIATNAKPKQIMSVLKKSSIIPASVDEKFGVVSFRHNSISYEVTTFRRDIYNGDFGHIKRYPDFIKFVQVAAEDAVRRDLTINAIYLNPRTGKHLDYVGGLKDIDSKIIRVIGEPDIRFQEDPIRLLRVVRFKHLLNFKYDPKTLGALKQYAHLIKKISPSVVKKEFLKIQSLSNYSSARKELKNFGLIQTL